MTEAKDMDDDEVTNFAGNLFGTEQCVVMMLDHHTPQAKLASLFVECCMSERR